METKICICCKKEKLLSSFEMYHNKVIDKIYPRNKCKTCINSERRDRREGRKQPPVRRIEVTPKCMTEVRDRFNRLSKKENLNIDYSFMTVDWFNLEVEKQQGKCLICERTASELGRRLVIDHDHVTGKYRGLLCTRCNTGLGAFGDNATDLLKALNYLMKK